MSEGGWTRAGVRRWVARHARGRRLALRPTLVDPALAGPMPPDGFEPWLVDYLLDRCGRPLVARDAAEQAWLDRSLLVRPIAPGSARPIADDLAAIVAAPRLLDGERLSERAGAARFASRADPAIAAAVGLLAPEPAVAAIGQLAAQRGPDEDRLHLALLQAGGALAWRPDLIEADGAGLADGRAEHGIDALIDALVGLFDRQSPRPVLDALAPVLGAVAAGRGARAARVRDALIARLRTSWQRIIGRRAGRSFLDEFRALDRARAIPDEDYFMTLPDRQLAEAAAHALGRSAEHLDPAGFVALQAEVLDGELGDVVLPPFVDGLIAAAAVAPLTELVGRLVAAEDIEPRLFAMTIAAQLPLDGCAELCLACLDDDRARIRAYACAAAAMLDPARAIPPLVARLDDPEPEVCACAGRALVELGQRDRVAARGMPGELAIGGTRGRIAAARAALGEPSVELVSTLLPLAAAEADRGPGGDARLCGALRAILLGSAAGIRLAAAILREVPAALPVVALALAGDEDAEVDAAGVALPAALRAELAQVLDPLIDAGGETGMLALETLSRFSLGDAAMIDRIAEADARTAGHAAQTLTALACVRRRSARAADLIAPWLDRDQHIADTVLAAAVAGVALPEDDDGWTQIGALLGLGTIAAAAAHAALVSRVRVRCEPAEPARDGRGHDGA